MNGSKMQATYLLVVLAIVVQHTFAETFIDMLNKCKVSDPTFDDCLVRSTNSVMDYIYKGNEEYGLKALTKPHENSTYNFTEKFILKLTNVSSHFGGGFEITSIHLGIPEKLITFAAKCPHRRYESNYEAVGEILGKPVHENGKLNVSFDDIVFNGTVSFEFVTKNDKKYLEANSCKSKITFHNFQFIPSEQVIVGEPMTAEQKKEYQSYIDKISETFKSEDDDLDKEIVVAVNKIFHLPFDQYFTQ